MTLDMNLTFTNHLQQVYNMVSHKCLLLSKLRKYINTHTAIVLYKSMILPVIEYGDVIYGGAKGKPINRLQKIRQRILRMCIYTNEHIETDQLYIMCKTTKLELRREVHLNLFMFRQQTNIDIVNLRRLNMRAHDALVFKKKKNQIMKNINKVFCTQVHLAGMIYRLSKEIYLLMKFQIKSKEKTVIKCNVFFH